MESKSFEEINRLATELVTLNPDKDAALIKTIQSKILDLVYSMAKPNNAGDNSKIDSFMFCGKYKIEYNIFTDALVKYISYDKELKQWNYKPEKSKLTTLLIETKNQKKYIKKADRESDSCYYDDGTIIDIPTDENDSVEKRIIGDVQVAKILSVLSRAFENYKDKKHATYYKAFYTHDVTRELKKSEDEKLLFYNDEIFPSLLQKLLKYLMLGEFLSLSDVIANKLRNGMDLSRRRENVAACLNISLPTATTWSEKYKSFINNAKNGIKEEE